MQMSRGILLLALCAALSACGGSNDPSPSYVIDPPTGNPESFATTGTVDGSNATELALKPGDSKQITVESGADIRVLSSAGVSWSAETNGTALAVKTISTTEWHVALSSDTTTTTPVRLTVTLGTKTATVDVTVNAQKYSPPQHKVGQQWTTTQDFVFADGTGGSSVVHYQITQVNPDNSFISVDSYGGQLLKTAGDESLGAINPPSASMRCDATRSQETMFPIFVGKTQSLTMDWRCTSTRDGSTLSTYTDEITHEVVGTQTVTINGVSLKTLKIVETIKTVKDSGNRVGNSTTGTVWWSPALGIAIRTEADLVYVDQTVSRNRHTTTQIGSYSF